MQYPTEEMIERYAIKMAQGNNGGKWATHYTDDQKQLWRIRAQGLITEIIIELRE